MMNTINTREDYFTRISPAPRDVWQAVTDQDPTTLIFQTPDWTDGLCASGEYTDASRLYELADGRRLLLPLVQKKSPIPGLSALSSMPDGWGMGGLLSTQPLRSEDVAMVLRDLIAQSALRITVRPNPLSSPVWDAAVVPGYKAVDRVSHILDLDGGFDHVWNHRFSTATRTKIRKSEKSGLVVERGDGAELLPVFYNIYMQWIDRRARERRVPLRLARWLGRYREPLHKFEQAANALGNRFRVWIARLEGTPVAAAILLVHGSHAQYWRSASVKELAGPVRANDLLQLRIIEDACLSNCRYYHMGESGGVDSLMHFKSRFGAESYSYHSYYRERLPLTTARGWFENFTHRVEARFAKDA